MRLSSLFLTVAVFLVAALMSFAAARVAVNVVEERSVIAVQEALIDAGDKWTSVLGDGLQVIIEGTAPSEARRFKAISIAGSVVDASRVIDNMTVVDPQGIAPPEFKIEILRNDSGVSLIGLIPTDYDRTALSDRIRKIAGDKPVTDLLEEARYAIPDAWYPSMAYALRALDQLPRSKISVSAGRVSIEAIADSADQKRRLESDLARLAPTNVAVSVTVSAPRPVISPFTTRFVLENGRARFDACAADTEAAEAKIVAAAVDAGLQGKASCLLALGVPSGTWGDAVALSIKAVKELGGGAVTLTDADVSLVAQQGTDQALFDKVVGELDNALPDLFVLKATLPQPQTVQTDSGPQEFGAVLTSDGKVTVSGKLPDDRTNALVNVYADARFGHDNVTMQTRVVPGLPETWTIRALASLDALAKLTEGTVKATPNLVAVSGKTDSSSAGAEISQLLVDKVGQSQQFRINVDYVPPPDPMANMPSPQDCIDQIHGVTADTKILFDPGSARITADSLKVVDAIAAILQKCPPMHLEIAGYTDSQGRAEMNLALSKDRANAVLTALRTRRVDISGIVAQGYGEADPIADNSTEAGREANRRIAISLLPDPAAEGAAKDGASGDGAAKDAAGGDSAPAAAAQNDPAPADATAAPAADAATGDSVFVPGAVPPSAPDSATPQGSGD
ncbi:MAG: OmpA family protein [Limimaricola sp.]|uniref:OmpA family protein n=1 Tax=Limimaricola sp. TaxID=2211665 RepID=UPI001D68ACE2|nr:OmpA family protein [Limimaricola sp.]MBI1417396.1 OmpA family protein [Limimaricola sp.]